MVNCYAGKRWHKSMKFTLLWSSSILPPLTAHMLDIYDCKNKENYNDNY